MKSQKYLLRTLLLSAFISPVSVIAQCGEVTIANMNWASAQLIAEIDKTILSKGYGCDVTLVPGDTVPTFTSMTSKGKPDIAPEFWPNSLPKIKDSINDGVLFSLSSPITDAGEGWYVNSVLLKKHPELTTLKSIIDHPEYFPYAEDPSKGAFFGCPAGWACQNTNKNLFKAFKMDEKGWVLVDPGSVVGLDGSIAKVSNSNKAWFGFYWEPAALVGKYDLKKIDFGVPFLGDEYWARCLATDDNSQCEDLKPSSWVESKIFTAVTNQFYIDSNKKESIEYLKKREIPIDVVNITISEMLDNQIEPSDAAIELMKNNPSLWQSWVSDGAKAKINQYLKKES